MSSENKKIIVIVGPTAVGKSDIAVLLANKLNGEIISADSRQVYKGLNIGTGKIKESEMQGITHHLLDVKDPKERFDVIDYVKLAVTAVNDIQGRNKIPIIVGGTGFYIQALVDGIDFPEVSPDQDLRDELSQKSADELLKILESIDREKAKELQTKRNGDHKNPRRLIRAIEIAKNQKIRMEGRQIYEQEEVTEVTSSERKQTPSLLKLNYTPIFIGIKLPDIELKQRIQKRLISRMNDGMIEEAKRLHENGLSFKRMDELGLEYRYLANYLQGQISKEELINELTTKIWQYSKRQMTWWKKDSRIMWSNPSDLNKILDLVSDFLSK